VDSGGVSGGGGDAVCAVVQSVHLFYLLRCGL
jgi:hypothetical protein